MRPNQRLSAFGRSPADWRIKEKHNVRNVRIVMTTYYATLLRPGARWDPDTSVREQPFWDEHARFMDSLFEAGAIILGGPFADRSGSLVIVAADSVEHVRGMFATDPWTGHDVLVVADVKEWTIFLDARERH
jgi:uncharacterized protein YciI